MPDYKAMYFHQAGQTATVIEVMEATVRALKAVSCELEALTQKLKETQLKTEEMFIRCEEEQE